MVLPKSDKARLTQTLGYIQNTTAVTDAVRTAVYGFTKAWAEMSFPNNKGAFYDSVQQGMSMKSVANAGNKETRKQRRAMVLIWTAMTNTDQANLARTMPSGRVADAFKSVMRKAKAKADMDKGIASGNQDIFDNHFRRNPGEFLAANSVVIYAIKEALQPADNLGDYFFYYQSSRDRYVIQSANPPPGAHRVRAVSVPAIYWGDVPGRGQKTGEGNFSGVVGTPLTGASTMVSTQFTGCSFCVKNDAGRTFAAHIAPSNSIAQKPGQEVVNINATTLAEQLGKNGNFGNANGPGTFRVYGRDFGKDTFGDGYYFPEGASGSKYWMTVIGFQNDGGGWSIYTQSNSADHPEGPIRVRQLFPAPAAIG